MVAILLGLITTWRSIVTVFNGTPCIWAFRAWSDGQTSHGVGILATTAGIAEINGIAPINSGEVQFGPIVDYLKSGKTGMFPITQGLDSPTFITRLQNFQAEPGNRVDQVMDVLKQHPSAASSSDRLVPVFK